MALERKDRIKDTTTTTGTGTVDLSASAPTGYRSFVSAVTSGSTVRYLIESSDLSEWEVGEGVFTDGTPDTLTRVTVYASSNSGSLVNFSAGTKNVSLIFSAADLAKMADNVSVPNLLKNGNFINNSTSGYGSTPDDWVSSNANPVQGGIPALTKQNVIDGLGVGTGDIELLCPLNALVNTDDFDDLSDNAYDLDSAGHVPDLSSDGLMGTALDFEAANTDYGSVNAANAKLTGAQTWVIFFKPESLVEQNIMGFCTSGGANIVGLKMTGSTGTIQFYMNGLTAASITSDVMLQTGKWYLIVARYNGSNELSLVINGVKKALAVTGTVTHNASNVFSIGRFGDFVGAYVDGLLTNAMILSVALSDDQTKKLLAMTLYKGQKIRRATTNAYLYQRLPQDLVERLRGKTVALRADLWQEVASTAQISIHQTMADATTDETIISATDATTGSWLSKVATGTLEADVVTVEIRIKHSTSDGNTWFKNVSLYEGSVLLPYDHSKDDWSRFPTLLQMRFFGVLSAYQFEERKAHVNPFTPTMRASGSMTVTSPNFVLKKFILNGDQAQNLMSVGFTNGGVAGVANYYTMPFVIDAAMVTASNGHSAHVVNNNTQTVGVVRCTSNIEVEAYIYTGGAWTLASGQTIHDANVYQINIS